MRPMSRSTALIVALAFALGSAAVAAPGCPSFDAVASATRVPLWDTGACQSHRPLFGICRMLRPVRG